MTFSFTCEMKGKPVTCLGREGELQKVRKIIRDSPSNL